MRTTVKLTDPIYRRLRTAAAERGLRGCSQIVEEALVEYLDAEQQRRGVVAAIEEAEGVGERTASLSSRGSAESVGAMADRPVLDSDVLIDYLRTAGPGHALVAMLCSSLAYRVRAISAFELALGRSYARDPRPVLAVLAVPHLGLTRSAAIRAGALLRSLRAEGRPIDVRDAMQAGICLDAGVALVTRNVRHVERVPRLRVLDPLAV